MSLACAPCRTIEDAPLRTPREPFGNWQGARALNRFDGTHRAERYIKARYRRYKRVATRRTPGLSAHAAQHAVTPVCWLCRGKQPSRKRGMHQRHHGAAALHRVVGAGAQVVQRERGDDRRRRFLRRNAQARQQGEAGQGDARGAAAARNTSLSSARLGASLQHAPSKLECKLVNRAAHAVGGTDEARGRKRQRCAGIRFHQRGGDERGAKAGR